jgi:putative ABC transport system substrate-binding protein
MLKTIRSIQIIVLVSLAVLLLSGCGGSQAQETFTIGVVNEGEHMLETYDGFKAGMAELGYVEGENTTYVYACVAGAGPEDIDREIENLLAQDVDLLFTLGTPPTLRAKQVAGGMDIPVIFAPFVDPVGEGIVESISRPGGNMTGIQTGTHFPKALEWLLTLAPASKVYFPYHPDDAVSVTTIDALREAASTLGVEVVAGEASTPEEVVAAIESLPEDTVVFLVPMPSLQASLADYGKAAMEHDIAIGTGHPVYMVDGVLVNFTIDQVAIGQQAARLADQALRGTAPADLPVEMADGFLVINLQTADAIGLEIPDDVLVQAKEILRGDK